jgi:hypothetical protein
VAVEAYRIWTEEDRNHSSPLNANHLVSSVLVPSEDSVSPGRNGFMIFAISLYLDSLATSAKCLVGKVIKIHRNYN